MTAHAPKLWQLTLLVSLLSMIGPFSIDTYLPAFESIEQELSISRTQMTQTLGAYLMAFATTTLIWGAIADWIGRKPVILLALGGYGIASIGCALATTYEQFLAFRILQGLAIGGSLISARAMVRDLLESKAAQKVMSNAMMLFAISPAIAPVIGAVLHDAFGWRSIFWFLSLFAFSVLLFSLITTHESLPKFKRNSIHIFKVSKVYAKVLSDPHYLRLVFILACAFSSFFLYVAGAPTILFNVLHYQPDQFYILFIPVVSGILIGAVISNHLIGRISERNMLNLFLFAMFFIALVNLLISSLFKTSIMTLLIPLIFYSISLATIMPLLSIMIINCFPHNRGSASAMQSFIHMGFNGISVNVIVAMLGADIQHFALAQLALISIGLLLWILDKRV